MSIAKFFENLIFRSDSERFFKYHALYATRPLFPVRCYCIWRCHRLQRRNAASISLAARFEGPPQLPHGIAGLFVSKAAIIGKNCTLHQLVTIGSNTTPGSKRQGAPVIGDNCFIGTGVQIIGGIRIGHNVKIGAGCTVTEDIPDNATVIPQKPRVLLRETEVVFEG